MEDVAGRLAALPLEDVRTHARTIGRGVRAAYDWPVVVREVERIVAETHRR
jgi:ubiquinone/menaquinone biosynthesis C-methylase UbiE